MKKAFFITLALVIAFYVGMEIDNYFKIKASYAEDTKMADWLIGECVSKGIVNINEPNTADSEKCVETICGKRAAETRRYGDVLETLKWCYRKHNDPK
jgi:hypothetical protein